MKNEIQELIDLFKKNHITDVDGGMNFLNGYFSKVVSLESMEWNEHMTKQQKENLVKIFLKQR